MSWGGDWTFIGTNGAASDLNLGTGTVTLGTPAGTTRTVTIQNAATTLTIGGAISNGTTANSLTKAGPGTLTLNGTNTYTGATTITAGSLLVNGSLASGSAVAVDAGTLGGTGTISGTVTIGNSSGSADSILAPGNSIESLDTGNLTFNSDGSYSVELNGSLVTTDVTNVTGTVSINAATTLTVSVAGTLSASQQFVIVSNDDADAVTGTFAGLAQNAVVGNYGGTDLKISYTGGDGNDIVLYTDASGSPYDTWATAKGLTGLPGSSTDPAKDADPDNDGSNNLAEFAFNGDPLSGSDNGKVYMLTEDSDFDPELTNKELILTCAVRSGTLAFTGSPSPSANQASDNITYSIEGSLDLASFPTTVNVVSPVITGLPVDPGAGYEYRSFSLNGSNGLTGKGFLRAKVTSP
jgi:autotransporter-associated beta strand protein